MGTQLQAARAARAARGWSQDKLLRLLQDAAQRRQIPIASPASLKTLISRWENGHATPDEPYRELFRSLYGLADEDLGFATRRRFADPDDDFGSLSLPVLSPSFAPAQVDLGMVDHFRALLTEYVRMDNLAGPRYVITGMRAQLSHIEELCGAARGQARDALLEIGTRFTEFGGWLHQDAGDLQAAMHWTNRAMDYAQELGDTNLTSYVLMRKSNIATDGGHAAQGLGLANAALRPWDQLTPGLRAVALRQKAYAHAMSGERGECAEALDQAVAQVHTVGTAEAEPDFTAYCTPSYVEMEAAHSWARLGRSEDAVRTYAQSLERWPAALRRDQGLCLSRLATVHASRGDIEQACVVGRKAAAVVRSAPSARTMGMLRALLKQLVPCRRLDAVDELRRELAGLV